MPSATPRRLTPSTRSIVFALVADGKLEPIVGGTYLLADAAQAHLDLEARKTTGKLVLDPVTS